jgi:hypothetical protein
MEMSYVTKTIRKGTKKTAAKAAESTATTVKKKPAAKKAAAKKTVAKKAPAKKAVAKKKVVAGKQPAAKKAPARRAAERKTETRRISAGDRRQMIAEAAYLRGEAQGFLSDEREDWLLAEAEVNMRLVRAKIEVIG